jgi:hypothetical protein
MGITPILFSFSIAFDIFFPFILKNPFYCIILGRICQPLKSKNIKIGYESDEKKIGKTSCIQENPVV